MTEYSERSSVTVLDFVAALQEDLGRRVDANSIAFFSGHPISMNLVHRVLTGQIAARKEEADDLFLGALLFEVEEAVFIFDDVEWKRIRSGPDRNVSLMNAFSQHCPDAGWLMSKAINIYFGRRHERGINIHHATPENEDFWRAALTDCNFPNAAAALVEKLGGGVIPEHLAHALDRFCADPKFETAWALILSQSPASQTWAELFMGFCGRTVPVLRLYSITKEVEFVPMCESLASDLAEHRRLKEALKLKGYTEAELDASLARFWAEQA